MSNSQLMKINVTCSIKCLIALLKPISIKMHPNIVTIGWTRHYYLEQRFILNNDLQKLSCRVVDLQFKVTIVSCTKFCTSFQDLWLKTYALLAVFFTRKSALCHKSFHVFVYCTPLYFTPWYLRLYDGLYKWQRRQCRLCHL